MRMTRDCPVLFVPAKPLRLPAARLNPHRTGRSRLSGRKTDPGAPGLAHNGNPSDALISDNTTDEVMS